RQERDRTGFRRDDRDEDEEPAEIPPADEVGLEVFLLPGEPRPHDRHGQDVREDDGQVRGGELRGGHGVSVATERSLLIERIRSFTTPLTGRRRNRTGVKELPRDAASGGFDRD